jgi:hypothetical protein
MILTYWRNHCTVEDVGVFHRGELLYGSGQALTILSVASLWRISTGSTPSFLWSQSSQ